MGYVLVHTSLLKDCAAYVEEQREYVEESAHYHGDDDDFLENARAPEDALLAQIDEALQSASIDPTGPIIHHAVRDERTGQTRHIYVRLESGGVALYVHDQERAITDPDIVADPLASTLLDVYGGKVRMLVRGEDQDGSTIVPMLPATEE